MPQKDDTAEEIMAKAHLDELKAMKVFNDKLLPLHEVLIMDGFIAGFKKAKALYDNGNYY